MMMIIIFIPQIVKKNPGLKTKLRLRIRIVRDSQKALAKKNNIKSLQNHTELLKEELGLASTELLLLRPFIKRRIA